MPEKKITITKNKLPEEKKERWEQTITEQMPHIKPPAHKKKKKKKKKKKDPPPQKKTQKKNNSNNKNCL